MSDSKFKCPVHPGKIVKRFMEDYGISEDDITGSLREWYNNKIPKEAIIDIIQCKPEGRINKEIANYFRIILVQRINFWMNLQKNYDGAIENAKQ